mgnify:CR=1 FL=1|tara:strand:- start:43451 stop:43642 length:192 start_codon:yes stop_codon:yes gene_type:complete
MDKITQIPTKPDKAKAEAERLKRNLPIYLQNLRLVAIMRRAAYNEYVAAGFTPEQALELCKNG